MDNLLIGRYLPQDSFIHNLDPRTKLVLSFYLIGITFLAHDWLGYGLMVGFTGWLIYLSNIKLSYFVKGLKPVIWLIAFTVILQVIFITDGKVILTVGNWHLTTGGLQGGIFIFTRFLIIIFISTLFTLTTSSLLISSAVESLLNPLRRFKFPVSEIALMISIALRFIPTLLDEVTTIMNAQRSRGAQFGSGGLIKQAKSLIPLLVPLFVNVFQRAEDLAIAMEARGYQEGKMRTKYRILHFSLHDVWAVIGAIIITILLMATYWVNF